MSGSAILSAATVRAGLAAAHDVESSWSGQYVAVLYPHQISNFDLLCAFRRLAPNVKLVAAEQLPTTSIEA